MSLNSWRIRVAEKWACDRFLELMIGKRQSRLVPLDNKYRDSRQRLTKSFPIRGHNYANAHSTGLG